MNDDGEARSPGASGAGETYPSQRSRLEALLSYALGAFSGIIFFVTRREDRFVQFHSLQSIAATFVALGIAALLWLFTFFPLLGFLYEMLLRLYQIALFLLWLWLLWQAHRGRQYRLPWIGPWAERQLS